MGQRIRTKPSYGKNLKLGGWLAGADTYLQIGDIDGICLGWISGGKLYKLAKAIVKQFEEANAKTK